MPSGLTVTHTLARFHANSTICIKQEDGKATTGQLVQQMLYPLPQLCVVLLLCLRMRFHKYIGNNNAKVSIPAPKPHSTNAPLILRWGDVDPTDITIIEMLSTKCQSHTRGRIILPFSPFKDCVCHMCIVPLVCLCCAVCLATQ